MSFYGYTNDEIKNWLQGKSPAQIAQQADAMGLRSNEIQQALAIGGMDVSQSDITGHAAANGYGWSPTGILSKIAQPAAQQSSGSGGMTVGGKNYTAQQIKDFYASGGNDNQFAQQAGITDPDQRRAAILQARQIAGPGTMAGDAGLQQYFSQYKQYNPNGADVGNYDNWLRAQNPHVVDAMRSGTYTGVGTSSTDWAPGGIYGPGTGHDFTFEQGRYGTGAHGTGDGWSPWSGASGGSVGNMGYMPPQTSVQPTGAQSGYQRQRNYIGGTYGGNPGEWGGYWDFSNGRSFPVGQYAYGNNGAQSSQGQQNRQTRYGSWPAGGGVVAPGGSGTAPTGSTGNSSDAIFGDFTNGW